MFSFYGNGPQGKSFKIAKVFNTYTALLEDCQASEVRDGDFVVISYGEIGTEIYTGHLNTDTNNNYGNKNSTFWEKHYYPNTTEDASIVFASGIHKGSGWGYRFIAQMTGNTPDISISVLQDIRPGYSPIIKKSGTLDAPEFTLHLQRGNKIWVKTISDTYNNQPAIPFDEKIGFADLIISFTDLELYEVNNIVSSWITLTDLNVKLSPIFNEPITETLSPNESASVELTGNESNGYTFTFKIPKGDTGAQGPQGERGLQGDSLVFIGVENVISFDLVSDSTFAAYNPTTTNEVVVVTAGEESRWYFKLNGHWVYTVSSGSSLVWQEL